MRSRDKKWINPHDDDDDNDKKVVYKTTTEPRSAVVCALFFGCQVFEIPKTNTCDLLCTNEKRKAKVDHL